MSSHLFACVTFFSPDTFDDIEENQTPKRFHDLLNALIPSENMLYAIRIDGAFSHVRTRQFRGRRIISHLLKPQQTSRFLILAMSRAVLPDFNTPRFMESLNAPVITCTSSQKTAGTAAI